MTDMDQPGIPGLDLSEPEKPQKPRTALESAVRETLAQLHALGYIAPRHAMHVSLAVALAQSIANKLGSGRTSTLAHDARELRDLMDSLIPESAGSEADRKLEEAMAQWQAAIESGGLV